MLSLPTMGLFALGTLWLHTLLVTLAGLQVAGGLARRLVDAWAHTHRATLVGGVLARQAERIGHWDDDGRLRVAERPPGTRIDGVRLHLGATSAAVPDTAELWIPPTPSLAGARAVDRGHVTTWTHEDRVAPGAPVYVVADLGPDGWVGRAGQGGRVLLATDDPRRVLAARLLLLLVGHGAGLVVVAGVSALALHDPFVDPVSTVGALAGLGAFLGILPLGTALRDAARPPGTGPLLHTARVR